MEIVFILGINVLPLYSPLTGTFGSQPLTIHPPRSCRRPARAFFASDASTHVQMEAARASGDIVQRRGRFGACDTYTPLHVKAAMSYRTGLALHAPSQVRCEVQQYSCCAAVPFVLTRRGSSANSPCSAVLAPCTRGGWARREHRTVLPAVPTDFDCLFRPNPPPNSRRRLQRPLSLSSAPCTTHIALM